MDTTILYHANCPDGLAAAFACHQVFGDRAQYLPVSYGHPIPAIPVGHTVYIVDFSYPEAALTTLWAEHMQHRTDDTLQIIVLDHHISAQRDLTALMAQHLSGMQIVFDLEESGASLTWKYLHARRGDPSFDLTGAGLEQAMPTFYKYIRDRDLWRWQLPDSKAISMAYWALEKDWQTIEQFAQDLEEAEGFFTIVRAGQAMQRYAEALVKEQAARAFWGVIGGHTVPIVNATTLFSEVGEYLCTLHKDAPFAAYFMDRGEQIRHWGVRSHGKVDLSILAQAYGGGGHPNAAGWTTAQGWLPDAPRPEEPQP